MAGQTTVRRATPATTHPAEVTAETLVTALRTFSGPNAPPIPAPAWYEFSDLETELLRLLRALVGDRVVILDYPVSHNFAPRWGYQAPPNRWLDELFSRNLAGYRAAFEYLATLSEWFARIPARFSHDRTNEPGWDGGPINAIDSALLYGFMVKHRPAAYVEIGSGITTAFAARAKRDHGLRTRILSFDPKPRTAIDFLCDRVVRSGLETADLSVFRTLEPGDIVFMDGSHRAFMNSDVTVFMLDVLPSLKPGVLVHVHDVSLPFDYDRMFQTTYWNEQYLLGSYLLGARDRVEILMPSFYATRHPEVSPALAPLVELGLGAPETWTCGGSMWFTHRS